VGFAEEGAHVIAVDVAEDVNIPQVATYARADVSDRLVVATLAESILANLGRVDVLANIAGIAEFGLSVELPAEEWDRTLAVNLTGAFICCQAFGRAMLRQRGGKIINIGSRCGFAGLPFHIAYNASKAGIVSLTQTLATEWGGHNVQVNAIVPGFVRTNMTKDAVADPAIRQLYEHKIPLGRISEPEDLVGPAIFLASSASDYVTGAVLVADGGNLASGGIGAEIRNEHFRKLAQVENRLTGTDSGQPDQEPT
jgi:NAD(P)-dependent dehydrogenase (short-subunit alcohol dehydrogenase family)